MNHLVAKTRGRGGRYFKVLSDQEIFILPEDINNRVEYNSSYKLEEDEWFAISEFSRKEYCEPLLRVQFVSTDYDQIPVDQYPKIEFLCSYQNGIYFLQKLSASQVMRKKWFSCSSTPTLSINEPIIVIDTFPDAIYIKDEDTLCFHNLGSLTKIFNGIDMLFREATQQETEQFLGQSFIRLADDYTANDVKKPNRKRIAMALGRLSTLTDTQRSEICNYIRGYCDGLPFNEEDGNFTISKEDDLKKLLYGLDERYYTTPHGNEKRLANSILKL